MGAVIRAAVLLALSLALPAAAAPAAVAAGPEGAVSGVRDPASGVLRLVVLASADEGLHSARAGLDGAEGARASFGCDGEPATCPSAGEATLLVPTTGVADGPHRLTVTVTDAAGQEARLVDRVVTVVNAPVTQQTTVVVGVGTGNGAGDPPGGSGGPPAGPGACASPRLKVKAAWRAPRVHGVRLVLRAGRRYPFAGRLTCVRGGRRVPAARGTRIVLLQKRDGVVLRRRSVRVGADGRFAVRLKARTRRTLVFRLRAGGSTVADVRLPVIVVPRGRAL